MTSDNIWYYIIPTIVLLEFLFEQYLAYRNRQKMSTSIPTELEGIYDTEAYAKQQEYQKVNSRFSLYSSLFSLIVILLVLLLGGFGYIDKWLRHYIDNQIFLSLCFLGIVSVILAIINTPFDYYSTFVIEERFGFNKSTRKTFFIDKIKSILLSLLIGGILLYIVIYLYYTLGDYAWLYAWGVVTLFSLFMLLFYSNLIVPLFNKQKPLEDGELRSAIESFASRAGFSLKNIYVMDASKRSTKANAYFTGLGAKKRIVLYDTLINDLSTDEIVAVLAHEIGHYKKKHTLQSLFYSIVSTGIILFLLSLVLKHQVFSNALGGEEASFHLSIIVFSILFTPLSIILGIFTNIQSRRNEYEADAFATSFGYGESLINGLKKLSVKSLSNLNPDYLVVFVYYSHPTLLQRMNAINTNGKELK